MVSSLVISTIAVFILYREWVPDTWPITYNKDIKNLSISSGFFMSDTYSKTQRVDKLALEINNLIILIYYRVKLRTNKNNTGGIYMKSFTKRMFITLFVLSLEFNFSTQNNTVMTDDLQGPQL